MKTVEIVKTTSPHSGRAVSIVRVGNRAFYCPRLPALFAELRKYSIRAIHFRQSSAENWPTPTRRDWKRQLAQAIGQSVAQ